MKKVSFVLGLIIFFIFYSCSDSLKDYRLGNYNFLGEYSVGLDTIHYNDRGKDIEIIVWYPVDNINRSKKGSVKDYLLLSETNTSVRKEINNPDTLKKVLASYLSPQPSQINDSVLNVIYNLPVLAYLNQKPTKGKFPLVLWGSRHAVPIYQFTTCEYLAGNGYVVAFAHSLNDNIPFPWEQVGKTEKLNAIEARVNILKSAYEKLVSMPYVDRDNTSALGWSYGGESAAVFQNITPSVKLVTSLSGNTINGWVYQRTDTLSAFNKRNMNVPFVILSEKYNMRGNPNIEQNAINNLPENSVVITVPEMSHGDFNAIEGFITSVYGIENVFNWVSPNEKRGEYYKTALDLLLHSLNHYLKNKPLNLEVVIRANKLDKDDLEINRIL